MPPPIKKVRSIKPPCNLSTIIYPQHVIRNVLHTFGADSDPLATLQKDLLVGGSFASRENITNHSETLLITRKQFGSKIDAFGSFSELVTMEIEFLFNK